MKGSRHYLFPFLLATLLSFYAFSLTETTDSIPLTIAEPVLPIDLADTLSLFEPDNSPLYSERMVLDNSETIFGTPHRLAVNDFSSRPLQRTSTHEWIFLVFLASSILVFFALLFFPYYSRQFFRSVVEAIKFSKLRKEEYFENKTPKWMLSINFLIVVSLMIALTVDPFEKFGFLVDLIFIGKLGLIFGAIVILFLIKRGVERFLSWVFNQKNVLEKHLETTIFFNNLSGIIFLPLVVVYHYNPEFISIDYFWVLLLFIFLVKITRRLLVWFRNSKLPVFYIFLYLCTVELAPLFFLIRTAIATKTL